ncbi:MAG TPA: lipid-binding SYLF domain-containing protein [Pyrinomonadaceae bacterium]|nr:lipid-binding SYLF domain-containing protein [Pyrinomonadaceae bacterium]
MKKIIRSRMFFGMGFAVLVSFFAIPAVAQKSLNHARDEAREAHQLLSDVQSVPAKAIPKSVLRNALAIAVFTNVKKGGFIVGGTGGDGVIVRKKGNAWGPPVYYDIGGADVGLQIGVKKSDVILVFMTESALNDLLDDEMELNAGIGATAGPVGETAGASTGVKNNVYVYSHSSGGFAGATVGGGSVKANNSINEALYKMKGGAVLTDASSIKMSTLPAELQAFTKLVASYTK